jgi:hypothetical protein
MPAPANPHLNRDFTWVLYIELPNGYPEVALGIEACLYECSPRARWLQADPDFVVAAVQNAPDSIVVFPWSSQDRVTARTTGDRLLDLHPHLIIVCENPSAVEVADFQARYGVNDCTLLPSVTKVTQIRACVQALVKRGWLRGFSLHAVVPERDPALFKVIEEIGQPALERLIARFFPNLPPSLPATVTSPQVSILPVEGGWSGAPMCRFYVDGNPQEYFLKLHSDPDKYEREFRNHRDAMKWMGRCIVEPLPLAEVPDDPRAYERIFNAGKKRCFPVCYKSASTRNERRENWKHLFEKNADPSPTDVLDAVLKILRANNVPVSPPASEFPWYVKPPDPSSPYFRYLLFTPEMRFELKRALADLHAYGEHMMGLVDGSPTSGIGDWKARCTALRGLVDSNLPRWLVSAPVPVALGHVHGDPNPRNCMVRSKSGEKSAKSPLVQMIDCGDYSASGRLVWDLAVIERDIKLVLMETDSNSSGYRDLDVAHLMRWCLMEKSLVAAGLRYKAPTVSTSAEKMLAMVRDKAKGVCRDFDEYEKHYFAALLYCTLDMLKEREVRRTKKLLALYSASEILRRFENVP